MTTTFRPGEGKPVRRSASASNEGEAIRDVPLIRGQLLGVTAAGPIYKGQLAYAIVPTKSAFALLQELAERIDSPDAVASSSLANRVSGRSAHRAWIAIATEITAPLVSATIRTRLSFLRFAVAAVRRAGRVDGLEPVLAAAVNAAWPWMSTESTNCILDYCTTMFKTSTLAKRHAVPVVDASARTVSLFGAGELAEIDIKKWRIDRALVRDEYISGRTGVGPRGNIFGPRGAEAALDGFDNGSSTGSLDDQANSLLHGNDASGAPGGLGDPGDLSGARGRGRSPSHDVGLDAQADDLLHGNDSSGVPGGLPSIGDLLSGRGQRRTASDSDGLDNQADDLEAGVVGSAWRGVSGFLRQNGSSGIEAGGYSNATPGGPFAPTGRLGVHGEGEKRSDGSEKDKEVNLGLTFIAGGLVLLAAGAWEIALPLEAMGVILIADGKSDPTPPPIEKPEKSDLYPDPDGFGDSGHPTTIWDENGGGGTPTTIWDENGGGGTPTTIWDENGGGGTPTTIWDENGGGGTPKPNWSPSTPRSSMAVPIVRRRAMFGPGLRANVVQVGPSTLRF